MIFQEKMTKIKDNQGNRRKMKETKEVIYFYEKNTHKNESCAVFISDHDPALFRAGIR